MNKETWKLILQIIVSVITAIATTLGVSPPKGGRSPLQLPQRGESRADASSRQET